MKDCLTNTLFMTVSSASGSADYNWHINTDLNPEFNICAIFQLNFES